MPCFYLTPKKDDFNQIPELQICIAEALYDAETVLSNPSAFKAEEIRTLRDQIVSNLERAWEITGRSEDRHGLHVTIRPPDTQVGRDIVTSIERGDVDQMSFGFLVKEQIWHEFDDPAATDIRELVDVDLFDVSPVTFPAYPDTTVAVRALREWKATARTQISRKALARMRLDFS